MAYPGPPGVNSAHPSLPPRPPPAPQIKKPPTTAPGLPAAPGAPGAPGASGSRFSSTFASASASPTPPPPPSYPGAPGFAPTTTAAATPTYSSAPTPAPIHYGAAPSSYASYPQTQPTAPPVRFGGGGGRGVHRGGFNNRNHHNTYHTPDYQAAAAVLGPSQYPSSSPFIQNPFPAPNAGAGMVGATPAPVNEEAEMAAQIAQWQSAYIPRDPSATDPTIAGAKGVGRGGMIGPELGAYGSNGYGPDAAQGTNGAEGAAAAAGPEAPADERRKTVFREGGGKKWADDTLAEWDPAHPRLFVGNLAGETTDESLLKAFSRWKSVQKAKVIRDKRTTKSKGFGFVSFSDTDDFFQAAKEMNGKYIQSHPVTVRKSTTEIKLRNVKDGRRGGGGKKDKKGYKSGNGGGGGGGGGGYEPHLGPVAPSGIVKPGQKTKGGLKLLG